MKLVCLLFCSLAALLDVPHASGMQPRYAIRVRHVRQAVGGRYSPATPNAYRPNPGYHSGSTAGGSGVNGGNQRLPPAQQLALKNAIGSLAGPVIGGGAGAAAWPNFSATRTQSGVGGYKFGGMASGRPAHGSDFVVLNAVAGRPQAYAGNNGNRPPAHVVYRAAGNAGAKNGAGPRPNQGYQSG